MVSTVPVFSVSMLKEDRDKKKDTDGSCMKFHNEKSMTDVT